MIFWIKEKNETENFGMAERLGLKVEKLEDNVYLQKQMSTLLAKEENGTFIVTPKIARLCENCFEKYKKDENVRIIIMPEKHK